MAHFGASLWRNFRVYQVFGATTEVGKTIFSTVLCRSAKLQTPSDNIWYLKPVSTGPTDDADIWHLDRFTRGINTQNFYQFDDAVSPHLAATTKIPDGKLVRKIQQQTRSNAESGAGFMLVETAGGPHSPGPSGTTQLEIYQPLRIPAILVGDWRLGGISTTISSYDALKIRGYDIAGVTVFQDPVYRNYQYLSEYFRDRDVPFLSISKPPDKSEVHDHASMNDYYLATERSPGVNGQQSVVQFAEELKSRHEKRVNNIETMADRAYKNIWYPFTQHKPMTPQDLTVIDSACGDHFQTLNVTHKSPRSSMLTSTVDGSSSWWTQGLGHANTELMMAAASAAGRYGHVMFASTIHQPAMTLAEKLLKIVENPRMQRVFYSDNGSTGMEVAVKMALKASTVRYDWEHLKDDIEIIGLNGSYHGDTIGAMDLSEPSVYNQKVPWYKGRGFWFDAPRVKMVKGVFMVEKPKHLQEQLGSSSEFASLQDVFDLSRDLTDEAAIYERYIYATIERLTQEEHRKFGALVMEPVVLGAGGMTLVDPLFQRVLTSVVRSSSHLFSPTTGSRSLDLDDAETDPDHLDWTGVPVVCDEVFTGLYRLGHTTASSMLHIHPDISVHAKLLTGGLVPLATTLASESIFEASLSDSKSDALLHGHSYTAHPVGCSVANKSLDLLLAQDEAGKWDAFKSDWKPVASTMLEQVSNALGSLSNATPSALSGSTQSNAPAVWSVWSSAFVSQLSHATSKIDGVWALGSILSISLRDADGASGYTSNAARGLQQQLLLDEAGEGWNIHSRVLGNVLYLMTSQVVEEKTVRSWEARVKQALEL